MDLLKDLLPFISIISIFGLYIIRTEAKIKILELEKVLLGKINENKEAIAKTQSDFLVTNSKVETQLSHIDEKLEEIKRLFSLFSKKVVGK
ncbi:hypothetical protein [Leptospira bouyouniensis]|uniref:DUF1640 domain-containing protein n=1 Tax=Leptospira bouyouniensis TaxID=2484911 RepID=A0ABY2L999_9LEPT|nr:hypothetical protein [Leptospira bouyouniensis]TGK53232.1 hypothetical protein EHQ10_05685 [Leptospira bouyouniensis]